MKFLLDQNLSPRLAELLATADYSAQHVRNMGLSTASDQEVLAAANQQAQSSSRPTPTSVNCSPTPTPTGHR